MSFWDTFFRKAPTPGRAALFDVDGTSMRGAFALYEQGATPRIVFSAQEELTHRHGESVEAALLREFPVFLKHFVHDGAPVLQRLSGSGHVDHIVAAIGSPWQEMHIRTIHKNEKKPFVVTESLIHEALAASFPPRTDRLLLDDALMGTFLNGYEVADPLEKSASRVTFVLLSSSIEEHVGAKVTDELRKIFHTDEVKLTTAASLRFQTIRELFLHERNCIIIDALGAQGSIALIRNGLLQTIHKLPSSARGAVWANMVRTALGDIAKEFPLPHMIFLLASPETREVYKKELDVSKLGSLWLSDNPPHVVSLSPTQISEFVKYAAEGEPDLTLLLGAHYARDFAKR